MTGAPWNDAERALVREHYPALGARGLLRALPGRTERSIRAEAASLGVRCARLGRGHPWSCAQLRILADGWDVLGRRELARLLRPHPWREVVRKARALRLGAGVPPGLETLAGAAARAGMACHALRRMLGRRGVKAVRPARWWRSPLYDPARIDAALLADLAAETLLEAARRLGVGRHRLGRAARRAGVRVVPGARTRLDPGQAEALLAAAAEVAAR